MAITSSNVSPGDTVLASQQNSIVTDLSSLDTDRGLNNTHRGLSNNPHTVTKTQVSLGSVGNYAIASEAEAEAGTSNVKYMTPLRTKTAIESLAPVNELEISATLFAVVARTGVTENFATIRAGAGNYSHEADGSSDSSGIGLEFDSGGGMNYSTLTRCIIVFDTSSIGNIKNVISASISLKSPNTGLIYDANGETGIYVAGANPASDTSIANADYGNVSRTEFGVLSYENADNITSQLRFYINLNYVGKQYIKFGDYTAFSLQDYWDLNNTESGLSATVASEPPITILFSTDSTWDGRLKIIYSD